MSDRDAPAPASAQPLLDAWRVDLASWALPQEILEQAPEPPWAHPVAMFTVEGEIEDSISHRMAREAVPPEGSVLDVGSGGGRASLALVPPASMLVAVDHQQAMLDAFAASSIARGVRSHQYLGDWPDVADQVPECDVVVCHHVAYNVAQIGPFLRALDAHALRRVVIEVPMHHPLSNTNALWKKFWGLDRPVVPTARDLAEVCRALGFDAHLEVWQDVTWGRRVELGEAERVRFTRARLCLPAERDPDIAAALRDLGDPPPREMATIWWDVSR
jgi:SAM-dependent methyltransferase